MSDPQVLLDRYELGDLIGAGGSARVHRAHDRRLDRPVAVKLLDATVAKSADPAAHARFLREARTSARFSHPNAVATYDAGEADGQLFIVMELVDGGSLADRIANDAPIADRHVVRIGTQLLSALGAAHAAGLVHRDVKPANVLLTRDGSVKLADFGIARRFDEVTSALTVEGMVMGTRAYLAPEQARGDAVGPQADLYAVGATLYEMATAERPPMSAADAERGADPRSRVAAVSPALAVAISTALAGRPERRFGSADAMATALSTAPQGAPPPPARVPPPPTATTTATMTAAMPAASRPTGAATRAPTRVIPTVQRPAAAKKRSRWWLLGPVVMLLLVGGIVTALALADLPGSASGTRVQTVATTVASAQTETTEPTTTTESPDTSVAATVPPTTAPPTTVPPTTTPPTTTPPTTTPTPDELIPGFLATDDIEQFIDQLRDRQSTAGKQSRKLGDGMRDVVGEGGDERIEEIEKLVEEIDEWVEKDELDPTVAGRAIEFLAELAAETDGDG